MYFRRYEKSTFTNTVVVLGKYNIWIINVEVMLRPNNFHFLDASAVKYYLGIADGRAYTILKPF